MKNLVSSLMVSAAVFCIGSVVLTQREFNLPANSEQLATILTAVQANPKLKEQLANHIADGDLSKGEYLGLMATLDSAEQRAKLINDLKSL